MIQRSASMHALTRMGCSLRNSGTTGCVLVERGLLTEADTSFLEEDTRT